MERHLVPQHVSGYEFRLIGDMTLKQFIELAFGVVMALISWFLPLPFFFKYPLVAFFGFLGFILAFVPINEQPLDRWIINFFKSIYSPTQYIFQKRAEPLELLTRPAYAQPADFTKQAPPADREKLEEYLKTVTPASLSPFDEEIEASLQKINSLFEEASPSKEPQGPAEPIKVSEIPEMPKVEKTDYKTIKPQFEPELPMPSKPAAANILVGMVLDCQGKILDDVIIEIKDKNGFPVRALKTNKLGQFQIATPLKNGVYEIELEKKGYQFDIIKFEAKGEIIEPLEIKAKKGPAHSVNPPADGHG